MALSDNYLKVELAIPRPSNQILKVEIGDIAAQGVTERNPLRVVA